MSIRTRRDNFANRQLAKLSLLTWLLSPWSAEPTSANRVLPKAALRHNGICIKFMPPSAIPNPLYAIKIVFMRVIIFFGPSLLLPLLIALIYRFTKLTPKKWTYILTYVTLVIYFTFLLNLEWNESDSSAKGWFQMYLPLYFIIILFIITPLSLLLQSIFFRILRRTSVKKKYNEHQKN